ncbi:MAG: universal stress protein [Saprospiraceae bacterium]|nr:universal stress protein [Saprospiraceae bacterium]
MNLIQLIGVGDNNYNDLRKTLSDLLSHQSSSRKLRLEEVNDIDTIMEFNLTSIPALAINGKVLYEQNGYQLSKEKLADLIDPYMRQVHIRNILVPTDFSAVSANAYDFAHDLALRNEGAIKVVHISHPSFDTMNPMGTYVPGSFEEIKRKQLHEFLGAAKHRNPLGSGSKRIPVEADVTIGFATEEIIRMSKEDGVDMIVMGTTGEGGFLNKLVGSVSSRVAQQAWCPVMLIPKNYQLQPFKNILYASNNQAMDEVMIREMVDFAIFHQANIHLIHVKENNKTPFRVARSVFEEIVQNSAPNLSYSYSVVESQSVFQGIQSYIKKHDIDLLSMVTSHRSFVGELFHKSLTKQMVFELDIPLLVLHFDY